MSSPRSCPKCSGIMEEKATSLILEEGARETKVALRVQAYSCWSCGFIEFWKA